MTEKQITRLDQIIHFVIAKGRGGVGVTRLEICRNLGLKKSPYTTSLINRCVADGWIKPEWMPGASLPTMIYHPTSIAIAKVDHEHDAAPVL